MSDVNLIIKRLEDINREITRIEFSKDYDEDIIQAAINARDSVETLMDLLR